MSKKFINFNNYSQKIFLVLCCATVISMLSCGESSETKKENDFLGMFEEGSGLIDKSNSVEPSESPSAEAKENETIPEEAEPKANDIEDPLESLSNINKEMNSVRSKRNDIKKEKKVSLGPLTSAPLTQAHIISMTEDNNGTLYFAESRRIIQWGSKQALSQVRKILTSSTYEADIKEDMPDISHINYSSGTLFVGFVNGTVASKEKYEWRLLKGGPQFTNNKITSIHTAFGSPFIGGTGLFQWDESFNRFLTVGDAKGLQVKNMQDFGEQILISTNYNLFSLGFPNKTFTPFFKPFREDVPLEEVQVFKDSIFIGTPQGALQITKKGFPLSRFAEDFAIKKIIPLDQEYGLLLSKQGSLLAYVGKKIYRSDQAILSSVRDIYLDQEGTLWVMQKIPLVLKGNVRSVLKWLVKKGTTVTGEKEFHKTFDNACDAAESLMTSSNYSGHVSRTLIDGRTHVFLKGYLTCPFGTGSIRADGLSVIVQGWELSIHQRNRREVIKIDEKIPADLATRVFMDSQDRIFLGTKKGLFILNKDGGWELPEKSELREDHISDIKEDGKGNIWVATRIKSSSDEAEAPREYQPLHTLTTNGWAHFGTDQGLDSFGISEIEIHEGNIFLGTSQGFAKISPRAEVMIQGPREGFTRSIIESISQDNKGRIWMGHGYFLSGLTWLKGSEVYVVTRKEGLFSDRIGSIGFDSKDQIWVIDTGGRTGVYSFDYLQNIGRKLSQKPVRVNKKKLLQ